MLDEKAQGLASVDMAPESGTHLEQLQTTMMVRKRNGSLEPMDVNKIIRAINRCCNGLTDVDTLRVATKTISGLYNGASTKELDQLSIQTSASLTAEEPQYAKLAARLLSAFIEKEVEGQGIHSFSQSVEHGHAAGLLNNRLLKFVRKNARKLDDAIRPERDNEFEYFGLKTVYDRYLIRDPKSRLVIESPQQFFLRVSCAVSDTVKEALSLYDLLSKLEYLPSTPTLFNSGMVHEQLSSCFLVNSPEDSLEGIYKNYADVARLSKFSGGIGMAFHNVRSRGSLIRGTNGLSNGIIPWLKTLDSSVAAVSQGSKRKGACCVYLEPWHADIEEFLELRNNTGNEANRTYNLNLSNWIPDLFMQRVRDDKDWSLFDPSQVPNLPELYGEKFEAEYKRAEDSGLAVRVVKARDLYAKMLRTLAETGNGWMNFKDSTNLKSNQTKMDGNVIHLSNLCTEICEVTSPNETAVCNLGSINLSRHTYADSSGEVYVDYAKISQTVRTAIRQLDRVIDINGYQTPETSASNLKWRPIGFGQMGLQDVFFQMKIPFDSLEARKISKSIAEEIYFSALTASCALAKEKGAHPNFSDTRAADGVLQPDLWGVSVSGKKWDKLREDIKSHGLRNSLMIAIAPTATIATIAGCYECIEPQISNLFKRETLSGDFLQVNKYLIQEFKKLGIWDDTMRSRMKVSEGSIQGMEDLPESLREVFRTVWEVPMRSVIEMAADRGAFVDQSQSMNLFMESPNIGKLSSMYLFAWSKGCKTSYYLRSRPATKIAKSTVLIPENAAVLPKKTTSDEAAVACSLENPETCSACE